MKGLATAQAAMPPAPCCGTTGSKRKRVAGPKARRPPFPAARKPERSLLLGFFHRALGGVGCFLGGAGCFGGLIGRGCGVARGIGVRGIAGSSGDRKSVVVGKSGSVRVNLGGRRIIKKNKRQ